MKNLSPVRLLILLLVCCVLVAVASYSLQSSDDESIPDMTHSQPSHLAVSSNTGGSQVVSQCQPKAKRQWAYQVKASIKTMSLPKQGIPGQVLYQSTADFVLDFAEQSQQVMGVASAISLQENGQTAKSIEAVPFLAFNQSKRFAQFAFFDDLSLVANHPMKLLNILIKTLSIAPSGEKVVYQYDPQANQYEYTHAFPMVDRKIVSAGRSDDWRATLSDDCLVEILQSQERLSFQLGQSQALMIYDFELKRIPTTQDISAFNFSAQSNAKQSWTNIKVKDAGDSREVADDETMWQVFARFEQSKSLGQLEKAAQYLMQNYTPTQLSGFLIGDDLAEATKRDLAFALSLPEGLEVQDYILDTLTALPLQTNAQGDVQKVRLMLALSGRSDVTEQSFERLIAIRNDPNVSDNVKNNVLITSGKLAKDLAEKGQTQAVNQFEGEVKVQLGRYDDNAASAILASGNAGLNTVNNQLIEQLEKGTEKSRYAAASVLVRDTNNYEVVIAHLAKEESLIVFQSAISGLDSQNLTRDHQSQLQALLGQLQQEPQSSSRQDKIDLLTSFTAGF